MNESLYPPPFDHQAAAQRHSPTSVAAAEAITPHRNVLREKVLAYIRSRGAEGATDEEGIDALAMSPSTYRPRRGECVELGQVRDSGRTRQVRSRKQASIWIAVEVSNVGQ